MVKRMYSVSEAADKWLRGEAKRLGLPTSELLRRLIDSYRATEIEKKSRKSAKLGQR